MKQEHKPMTDFHEKMLSVSNPNYNSQQSSVLPLPDNTPISISVNNKPKIKVEKKSVEMTKRERATITKALSQMYDNIGIGRRNIQHKKKEKVGYW